jgi:hypothetical protein
MVELHNKITSSKRIDERSYCVIVTGQPGIGEFNLTDFICLSALKAVCAQERVSFSNTLSGDAVSKSDRSSGTTMDAAIWLRKRESSYHPLIFCRVIFRDLFGPS